MVRTLEETLSNKKKLFYEENDRIRRELDDLIAHLEEQLRDTPHELEVIFRFYWDLPRGYA
jgi:hypothetical protein